MIIDQLFTRPLIEAIQPGDDTVASVKKLWQYINRNLTDLASNASFYDERGNQPYIEDRLANLLKTSDGDAVTIAFDMGGNLEFDNNVLYVPVGNMWRYRGLIYGADFVKRVVGFLSKQNMAEATDPKRDKAERMIWKYFGQIYDYGDDDGLNYLDEQGDLWNQLMDKYNGEIDDIVAQEPIEVLMQAAQELKGIAGDMKYELDEADLADPSRRGFLKKAAGAAAAGAAMSATGPEIVTLVKGFAEQAGGMNGIQALKAMLKVATADELYNMYDYYSDSGILADAITDSDMRALQRVKGFRDYEDWSDFEEYCEDNNDVNPVEEFERLTGRPLKVSLVDDIVGKIDDTWSLENFFDEYPDALKLINPFGNGSISRPTMQQLAKIDTAAKGASLPTPIVAMANAVAGLVRQIFKANGQPLSEPQQVAQGSRAAPALPAPTRPEFDMTPDLKQKEKVPVQRKGDDEEQYYRPAPEHIQQALDAGQLGDKNFFQSIVDGTDKNPWVTPEKAQEILNKYYGPQDMAEGEYDSRKPFGVRYKVFAGREGRVTTREYWTSSEQKLQRAVAKIEALDNFYEIDGYSYPKEQQGVAEGETSTPAIYVKGGGKYPGMTIAPKGWSRIRDIKDEGDAYFVMVGNDGDGLNIPKNKVSLHRIKLKNGMPITAKQAFMMFNGWTPDGEQGVAEGVAETVSMDQAKKVLRHYGADHFKTTTNELHFYKNGQHLSVDLIFNDDATRSVSLRQLNSATRRLKGQGVAKGQQIDEVFADQGSGSTDRDNAEYMKRRRAAKKAAGSKESYMIIRTDAEGKRDVFAGNFDTYERAQKELDGLLAHPLHTKHKQKFEIKRKGQKDITEMDKSEPSAGRDTGPRSGPDKEAKPISKEKMTKDAGGMLNRAFKDSHKKKDVKESDSLMMKLRRAMVQEGRVKELADDLKTMSDAEFMKKYGKAKAAIRADMTKLDEAGTSRLGKKDIDFRDGFVGDEPEFFEPDVRIGKPVEPDAADTDAFMSAINSEKNPYMQSWGGKYADQDTNNSPLGPGEFNAGGTTWRFVRPGERPGSDTISGTGTPDWRSIAAAGKPAAASGLPKMRFDRASNSLVPVDAPPALDLSPKTKDKFDRQTRSVKPADGSGANPNIDAATRDRALAYAAQQNAPAAAAKQKVDWKAIYALNKATIGSNPNIIKPRMQLNMPNGTIYLVQPGDTLTKIAAKQNQVNELSTEKLAQYKTAAARDARAADQAGDIKRGDKRFSGIVKATKKQFDNDAKQVDESRAARRALMARIVNHR
jgi:hypothetical protein